VQPVVMQSLALPDPSSIEVSASKKAKNHGSLIAQTSHIASGPVASATKLGIGQERGTKDKPSQ
jgi:hypothetical protein